MSRIGLSYVIIMTGSWRSQSRSRTARSIKTWRRAVDRRLFNTMQSSHTQHNPWTNYRLQWSDKFAHAYVFLISARTTKTKKLSKTWQANFRRRHFETDPPAVCLVERWEGRHL